MPDFKPKIGEMRQNPETISAQPLTTVADFVETLSAEDLAELYKKDLTEGVRRHLLQSRGCFKSGGRSPGFSRFDKKDQILLHPFFGNQKELSADFVCSLPPLLPPKDLLTQDPVFARSFAASLHKTWEVGNRFFQETIFKGIENKTLPATSYDMSDLMKFDGKVNEDGSALAEESEEWMKAIGAVLANHPVLEQKMAFHWREPVIRYSLDRNIEGVDVVHSVPPRLVFNYTWLGDKARTASLYVYGLLDANLRGADVPEKFGNGMSLFLAQEVLSKKGEVSFSQSGQLDDLIRSGLLYVLYPKETVAFYAGQKADYPQFLKEHFAAHGVHLNDPLQVSPENLLRAIAPRYSLVDIILKRQPNLLFVAAVAGQLNRLGLLKASDKEKLLKYFDAHFGGAIDPLVYTVYSQLQGTRFDGKKGDLVQAPFISPQMSFENAPWGKEYGSLGKAYWDLGKDIGINRVTRGLWVYPPKMELKGTDMLLLPLAPFALLLGQTQSVDEVTIGGVDKTKEAQPIFSVAPPLKKTPLAFFTYYRESVSNRWNADRLGWEVDQNLSSLKETSVDAQSEAYQFKGELAPLFSDFFGTYYSLPLPSGYVPSLSTFQSDSKADFFSDAAGNIFARFSGRKNQKIQVEYFFGKESQKRDLQEPTTQNSVPLFELNELAPDVARKVAEIIKIKETLELANEAESYVSHLLAYTNDARYGDHYRENPKEFFSRLSRLKHADCDTANTFLAGILRLAGIPVRFAHGHGSQNYEDKSDVITAAEGHGWVEYWDANKEVWKVADGVASSTEEGRPFGSSEPSFVEKGKAKEGSMDMQQYSLLKFTELIARQGKGLISAEELFKAYLDLDFNIEIHKSFGPSLGAIFWEAIPSERKGVLFDELLKKWDEGKVGTDVIPSIFGQPLADLPPWKPTPEQKEKLKDQALKIFKKGVEGNGLTLRDLSAVVDILSRCADATKDVGAYFDEMVQALALLNERVDGDWASLGGFGGLGVVYRFFNLGTKVICDQEEMLAKVDRLLEDKETRQMGFLIGMTLKNHIHDEKVKRVLVKKLEAAVGKIGNTFWGKVSQEEFDFDPMESALYEKILDFSRGEGRAHVWRSIVNGAIKKQYLFAELPESDRKAFSSLVVKVVSSDFFQEKLGDKQKYYLVSLAELAPHVREERYNEVIWKALNAVISSDVEGISKGFESLALACKNGSMPKECSGLALETIKNFQERIKKLNPDKKERAHVFLEYILTLRAFAPLDPAGKLENLISNDNSFLMKEEKLLAAWIFAVARENESEVRALYSEALNLFRGGAVPNEKAAMFLMRGIRFLSQPQQQTVIRKMAESEFKYTHEMLKNIALGVKDPEDLKPFYKVIGDEKYQNMFAERARLENSEEQKKIARHFLSLKVPAITLNSVTLRWIVFNAGDPQLVEEYKKEVDAFFKKGINVDLDFNSRLSLAIYSGDLSLAKRILKDNGPPRDADADVLYHLVAQKLKPKESILLDIKLPALWYGDNETIIKTIQEWFRDTPDKSDEGGLIFLYRLAQNRNLLPEVNRIEEAILTFCESKALVDRSYLEMLDVLPTAVLQKMLKTEKTKKNQNLVSDLLTVLHRRASFEQEALSTKEAIKEAYCDGDITARSFAQNTILGFQARFEKETQIPRKSEIFFEFWEESQRWGGSRFEGGGQPVVSMLSVLPEELQFHFYEKSFIALISDWRGKEGLYGSIVMHFAIKFGLPSALVGDRKKIMDALKQKMPAVYYVLLGDKKEDDSLEQISTGWAQLDPGTFKKVNFVEKKTREQMIQEPPENIQYNVSPDYNYSDIYTLLHLTPLAETYPFLRRDWLASFNVPQIDNPLVAPQTLSPEMEAYMKNYLEDYLKSHPIDPEWADTIHKNFEKRFGLKLEN
ncbi:MAG: transglutaminase domain-containing protein [Deltaproteobacteria bacterium]|nr:transglutaminase domain-containing protein [Deltaproteobacteria bacterium]